MKNKTLGKAIAISVALAILTAIFESSMAYETAENLYMLAGLGMIIFGIWGSIRLLNSEE